MSEISVIIPVYNKARYIEETIKSVLSQTFQDFEIIVIDDGSTDESSKVLKKYINRQKIAVYRQKNKGCPAALNKGIMLSKGKYICWLSADDVWYKNKLEMQVKEFEKNPNIDLIYTDTDHIDENGNVIIKHVRSADKDTPLPVRVMSINGSSVMFKKYCIRKTGMFDEELRCCNDTDMWYKFGKYFKMKKIPLPLLQSRQGGDRLTNNQEMMVKYYSICLVKNNLPLELGLMRLLGKDPKLAELNFIEGKRCLHRIKRNYYFYRMRTFLFKKGWYYFCLYIIPVLDKKYELFKKDVLDVKSLRELFKRRISIKWLLRVKKKISHKRVLFVYHHNPITTFEDIDRKILSNNFITHSLCFSNSKDKKMLLRLFWKILWADVVISWFADWHSYYTVRISRFLKKKSIIITGGYDISAIPEIGYGIAGNRPNHLYMVRDVLAMSNILITNSLFAKKELLNNFDINEDKVCAIYHGFNIDLPGKDNGKIKEDIVLTVASINKVNLLLKGLRTFVESARYLPNMRFILIGPNMDESLSELKKIAPPNVEFIGGLYGKDLIAMYRRAKVYVQLSMYESFGCALAEAMLHECVPVVTRKGALPEVVGECGFYVPANNPKEVALAIDKASANLYLGKQARTRIITKFPLKQREGALRNLVNSI